MIGKVNPQRDADMARLQRFAWPPHWLRQRQAGGRSNAGRLSGLNCLNDNSTGE